MSRRQREKFYNDHVNIEHDINLNKPVNTKVPQLARAKVKAVKSLANGTSVRNPNER